MVNSTVRSVFLCSGSLGAIIVPKIHHLENVQAIVILCIDVEGHKKWADKFDKVKLVTDDFEKAKPQLQ